ncbi:MAG: carboxypeptidase-like regulatory domain-containing protein [Acidobacteria bacterium]|nr:carboxypeptidase-like regulatory domain-containing protein [Acidobacteriota bacterium]
MKRILILTMVLALGVSGVPLAAQQPQIGTIEGFARDACQSRLKDAKIQLRNVDTGVLAGSTITDKEGKFTFAGILPANYVAELLNKDGKVTDVSKSVAVAAGAVVKDVAVGSSAPCAVPFFLSTAGLLLLGAIAAGAVVGVVVTNTSPSR